VVGDAPVKRHVCSDHDVVGEDFCTAVEHGGRRHAVDDVDGFRAHEPYACCACGLGQAGQVFERMEAGLVLEAKRRLPQRSLAFLHISDVKTGALRCLELPFQFVRARMFSGNQIPGNPLEVARDEVCVAPLLDALDRGTVAGRRRARSLLPVPSLQQVEPVIERTGQMGAGTSRFAGAEPFLVDHDDALAGLGQGQGNRHTGNSGADHAYLRPQRRSVQFLERR
jgi:hypothetical protein